MTHPPPHVPVIGLLGGIASGKSHVARAFTAAGCVPFDADALVADMYRDPGVLAMLADWWGPAILRPDGTLDRAAVARIIFADDAQRHRLEAYIHPRVRVTRDAFTKQWRGGLATLRDPMSGIPCDPAMLHALAVLEQQEGPVIRAVVWDVPLLMEIGQENLCDLLVFVDSSDDLRRSRARARGWPEGELARREALQTPLDEKRRKSHVVIDGGANESDLAAAVEAALDRVGAPRHPL